MTNSTNAPACSHPAAGSKCDWPGCRRPALTDDLFCEMHRACEDAIEVDGEGNMTIRPGTTAPMLAELRKVGALRGGAHSGRVNQPQACSPPPAALRWEWRPDPLVDGAELLTAVCEACGAVLPPRLPAGGVWALVDQRPRDETAEPAAEAPEGKHAPNL